VLPMSMVVLASVAFLSGGIANPLYSLMVAYVNDYLEADQMAGASAGLLFIYGLGSIGGPLITGWLMALVGPDGFFLFIAILFTATAFYALYRMGRGRARLFRRRLRTLSPGASAVATEAAVDEASKTAPAAP
jgi:MFS family permease